MIINNITNKSFNEELINEQSYNIINIFENNFVIQILICYFARGINTFNRKILWIQKQRNQRNSLFSLK